MPRILTKEDQLRLERRNIEILKILKKEARKELKKRWIGPARRDLLEDLLKKDKLVGLDRWQPSQKAIHRLRDSGLLEDTAIFPEDLKPDFPDFQRWDIQVPIKKLRPCQKHKLASIDVAVKFWEENPPMTIQAISDSQEIINVCEGRMYREKTIRNWIKDYCPNRKPGRRPEKKD